MARPEAPDTLDIQVRGERVGLRPFRGGDITAVEAWCQKVGHASPDSQRLAIALRGSDEPIGFIDYRGGQPEPGWLTIGHVAVAPALRAHGYASEAVRLLEEQATRLGLASRFRALLDPDNGLSLYFWLRLGYRPVAAEGIIAMVRTVQPLAG